MQLELRGTGMPIGDKRRKANVSAKPSDTYSSMVLCAARRQLIRVTLNILINVQSAYIA